MTAWCCVVGGEMFVSTACALYEFVEIYLFNTPPVCHIYGFSRSFKYAIFPTETFDRITLLSICDDSENMQASGSRLLTDMCLLGTLGSGPNGPQHWFLVP